MVQFNVLEYIAILFLLSLAIYLFKHVFGFIYVYFIGPSVNKVNFKSKGQWALVTGCTDGIGKEYARQLAARGCDIILISRSIAKLEETAGEIEKEFKVMTKLIQVDYGEDDSIYNKINKEIVGLEIGTLVNNVGVVYPYPEYFLDVPEWERTISTIIKVNIMSVTRMTHLVLPQMVKRGKGVIINIGSVASLVPGPMFAVYAASKAYVKKFTEDLSTEYAGNGIIIQCAMPGYVVTKMSGLSESSLIAPMPETYVKSALSLVGTAIMTTGYLPHAIIINLFLKLNRRLASIIVVNRAKVIRKREIEKYKKQ